MMIRRVVVCMALVACIALVSPVWGDRYHSHLLPGDLRPAAEALGIDSPHGYYVLAELFEALISRIQPLESVVSDLGSSVESLQSDWSLVAARVDALESAQPSVIPFISIVDATTEVKPGNVAYITIQTQPHAECSIIFTLPSGHVSRAAGLTDKRAGESGVITWAWLVGAGTSPGTSLVLIAFTTADDTHTVSVEAQIEIMAPE